MSLSSKVCSLVTAVLLFTAGQAGADTGIIPANVMNWTFQHYNPLLTSRTILQPMGVPARIGTVPLLPPRPGAIASFDRVTFVPGEPKLHNVEAFDLKLVTLTRLSDMQTQVAQMWIYLGNAYIDGREDLQTFHTQVTWPNGTPAGDLFWDLNHNGIADDGANTKFRITVPGKGHPFAFHETYDQDYIINTWADSDDHQFRIFWAATFKQPACVYNPYWTSGGVDSCGVSSQRFSLQYYEAFWADSNFEPEPGDWQMGGGNLCPHPAENASWPCSYAESGGTKPYFEGSLESLAKDVSAMWWSHSWYPGSGDQLTTRNAVNVALGRPTQASSTYPGYSTAAIADGNRSTDFNGWANNDTTLPQWVSVDLGPGKAFFQVNLYTTEGYAIRDYELQVKSVGPCDSSGSWTTLPTVFSGSGLTTNASLTGNTRSFVTAWFENDVTAQCIRVLGKSGPTAQGNYVRVNELEVYSDVN